MASVLLSLCIPTRDRNPQLEKTLASIAASFGSDPRYEIVVADNSEGHSASALCERFRAAGAPIVYRPNRAEGFLNSIEALRGGTGQLLKLINNYTMFQPDAGARLLAFVSDHSQAQPPTLFTDGNLGRQDCRFFGSFEDFLKGSSYFSTWSTAFSIWRRQFELLDSQGNTLDPLFPHTSVLFRLTRETSYCVDDQSYFVNQEVSSKGGYNLFRAFSVNYLNLVQARVVEGAVSSGTMGALKKALLNQFLIPWYQRTKLEPNAYTFDLTNIRQSILEHYHWGDYVKLVVVAHVRAWAKALRNVIWRKK